MYKLMDMLKQGRWMTLIFGFALTALTALTAQCQQTLIDQQNEPATNSRFWVPSGFTVAQEFVPSLPALSFVDIVAEGEAGRLTALQVEIHHGGISGNVVGTSWGLQIPAGSADVVRFTFGTSVPLIAGDVYVLTILPVSGGAWGIAYDPAGGYTVGRMLLDGQPQGGSDLWFDEGWVNPGPDDRRLILGISHDPFFPTVAVTAGSLTNTNPNRIRFYVEYSDDLLKWQPLQAASASTYTYGMTLLFPDLGAGSVPRRFYRAVDTTASTNTAARVNRTLFLLPLLPHE
jgi:hypothetical protein